MASVEYRDPQSESSTSSSLLKRVKDRDPAAWQRLVELYGPLVFYWGGRGGLSAADAADLMQDVFAAVHGAVDRFWHDPEAGTFRGWLWTITRNKIRDHYRRIGDEAQAAGGTAAQQRLAEVPDRWDDESADPRDRSELGALHRRAMDLIRAEFEERTWQAFWRAVVDEEPTGEIAADLGISANAVRQYKSRVLRRLRQELGDLRE